MIAFLKNHLSWETIATVPVSEYELYTWTTADDKSKIIAAAVGLEASEGDILIAGDFIGVIDTIEEDDATGVTTIYALPWEKIFARKIIYATPSATTTAGYIAELLNELLSTGDPAYTMPYITVTAGSSPRRMIAPNVEDGLVDPLEYMTSARRLQNVIATATTTSTGLQITIAERDIPRQNVDTEHGALLISEAYSRDTLAKLTALNTTDGTNETYYALEDGTISTDYRAEGRLVGRWETKAFKGEGLEDAVEEEFAKNKYSHKIEFATARELPAYAPVALRIRGQVLYSYINKICKSSASSWPIYTSGELRTLLTEKIKRLEG